MIVIDLLLLLTCGGSIEHCPWSPAGRGIGSAAVKRQYKRQRKRQKSRQREIGMLLSL